MEMVEEIDSNFVDGWDKNGVHCWSTHTFDSLEFVENNSEHICLVDRKSSDGRVKSFEFRKYVNKSGNERFIMFDADSGMDSQFEGKKLNVHITDGAFFRKFCDGMLKCGEISEAYHDILVGAIIPIEISELDELL